MCSFVSSDRAFEFDPKIISLIFDGRILKKKIISNDVLFFALPCSVSFSLLVLSSFCLCILLFSSFFPSSFLFFPFIFSPSFFTLLFLGSPSFFLSFRFLALFHSLFSFSFHLSLSSSLFFVLLFVFNNEVNRTHRATVCINLYPALSCAVCRRVHFVYVRYMETVEGNIVCGDKKFSGETYWYRLDAISWNGRSFL